uniref:Uncharacterized protein n=1 Tax=Onchocerca volvulus TaxID=6282 RepID=A0A8R1XYA0_ONCVO
MLLADSIRFLCFQDEKKAEYNQFLKNFFRNTLCERNISSGQNYK